MRVLLAIDGSAHSDAAVAEVATHPWPKGTSVRVLTVVHATAPLIPDPAFVIAAIHVEQTKEQSRHAPKIVAAARRRIRRLAPDVSVSTRIGMASRRTSSSKRRANGAPTSSSWGLTGTAL